MTQSTIFNGFMELEVYILGTNHERIRSQISDIYRTAKLQENINQSHWKTLGRSLTSVTSAVMKTEIYRNYVVYVTSSLPKQVKALDTC